MKKTMWLLWGAAGLVILVDQAVKYFVSAALEPGAVWSPLPGPNPLIQIIHAANTGFAFGLFKDLGIVPILVPLIISGVIVLYARRLHAGQKFMALALGLTLGGALGNVIDRLRIGYVIDYFDIGIGALRNASNFADWSIVLGVILLSVAMLLEERKLQKEKAAGSSDSKA